MVLLLGWAMWQALELASGAARHDWSQLATRWLPRRSELILVWQPAFLPHLPAALTSELPPELAEALRQRTSRITALAYAEGHPPTILRLQNTSPGPTFRRLEGNWWVQGPVEQSGLRFDQPLRGLLVWSKAAGLTLGAEGTQQQWQARLWQPGQPGETNLELPMRMVAALPSSVPDATVLRLGERPSGDPIGILAQAAEDRVLVSAAFSPMETLIGVEAKNASALRKALDEVYPRQVRPAGTLFGRRNKFALSFEKQRLWFLAGAGPDRLRALQKEARLVCPLPGPAVMIGTHLCGPGRPAPWNGFPKGRLWHRLRAQQGSRVWDVVWIKAPG